MQEKYIKPKKNFIVRLSGKRDRFLQRLYIYDWTYIFHSQRRGVQLLRLCFCDFCFGFIPESESFTKISQFSKKWVYFLKCHNFFSEGASELKFSRKIWEVSEFPRKLSLLHFYMFHISISSKVDHPLIIIRQTKLTIKTSCIITTKIREYDQLTFVLPGK
jgi:hypothetical protein